VVVKPCYQEYKVGFEESFEAGMGKCLPGINIIIFWGSGIRKDRPRTEIVLRRSTGNYEFLTASERSYKNV
jgi:hypothetical protein